MSMPEGWVLVPREPTEAMKREGVTQALSVSLGAGYTWPDYMADLWSTMLAASPQPEAYGVRAGLSAEDRNRAIVAGIKTSERLHAVDHTFSPAYLGMAIAQDAIRALSHTEQETKP